ncbi:flagellar hook assembly protein FlgD [Nocardioides sp. Kera G14]|uniref:flagellar hook assembly protein FlgD n=1 Tax=Nocardioides sp. Kera G14 TaxID=2884264 RepID=UPI001D125BC6|nr:flagellar hook capping FlgD N-terminal domain-containing protein [Nocardioides sp. Kera G14]UDY24063.1 hypothetical protein LH076_01840 [Nocardioides sp. Kera G14]
MTVSAVEGTTNGILALANAASGTSSTTASSSEDQDMYLQLMVAQMKYQDPMNPVSTTDMLSQNAQFESLTQLQDINDELSQVLSAQLSFGAMGMLGQTVAYTDANGVSATGTPSAVNFTSTGPVLTIGDASVPVASVTGVSSPSTSTSSTSTSSSSQE